MNLFMFKKAISISLAIALGSLLSMNIFSYTLIPATDRYEKKNITISNGGMNSYWWNNVGQAAMNWNSTPTIVTVATTSSGYNQVIAHDVASTWYGWYNILERSNTSVTKFRLELNSRSIFQAATNHSNFVTSTTVHELGHAFGLGDLGGSTTIMSKYRNRNEMTTPQTDDINGVNAVWK
jgi:hypothetical protein